MPELLLDPDIRLCVLLPIVMITFLLGILRYYLLNLLPDNIVDSQQFFDSQALIRARLLRKNGHFIQKQSFQMRRHYFNNERTGYLISQERNTVPRNPMADPNLMIDMMKHNLMNVLSTIFIGGWIDEMFSGFLTTKVPFPLTLRFKPMLQKDIHLESLDAAWVSSASWFFLNIFGLPPIYAMLFGEVSDTVQVGLFPQQNSAIAMIPKDMKSAFRAEWEALEILDHQFSAINITLMLEDC